MYEFDYLQAARASLKEVKQVREDFLNYIKSQMGGVDPELLLDKFKESNESSTVLYDSSDEQSFNDGKPKYDEKLTKYIKSLSPHDLNAFSNNLELYYYIRSSLNVVIEIDKLRLKDLDVNAIDNLIEKAKELNVPLKLFVSGFSTFGNETEHVDMLFDTELLNVFVALNSYLKTKDVEPIRFLEDPQTPFLSWNLEHVLNANKEIDAIVETIKNKKFSPYEAAAFIHYYITSSFEYKENLDDELVPRSIVGVLNTDNIVCVGYAKFYKAVIDKLNMEGLSAQTIQSCLKPPAFNDFGKMVNKMPLRGFLHLQNLVTVKDAKYNIDGTYFNDACWDAKNANFPNGKGFACFMFPVKDIFKLEGYSYEEDPSKDRYNGTRMVHTEKLVNPSRMPVYRYANKSKPISIENLERCLYNVFAKTYLDYKHEQIVDMLDYYMPCSKLIAASLFREDAENCLVKEGKVALKEAEKEQLESNQIIR